MKKPWYGRKLIWLNAASGGLAFVVGGWAVVSDSLPLPKWALLLVGGGLAALNVGLHFVTTDATTEQMVDASDGISGGDGAPK